MKKRRASLTVEELHELKWLISGLLALLALWSLVALDMGLELHLLFCGLAVVTSLLRPIWIGHLPEQAWLVLRLSMLGVVLTDFMLSMPQTIPPLVRMVILILLYRMLAKRQKREDLQLLLLCFFCLVISGTLTVSLLFGFQILLFVPLALSFLFIVCLLDREPESRRHLNSGLHFSWIRLFKRLMQVLDFRAIGLGVALYLFVVFVSSGLFVMIPRFNLDQAIPFLQVGTKSYSGFSDEVKLGAVSEITEDNGVALRIDVPSLEDVDDSPYWRMLVLDEYENGGFRMSSELKTKFRKDVLARELYVREMNRNKEETGPWTFYLEGGVSRYLPMPGPFRRIRFQGLQKLSLTPDVHVYGTDIVQQSVFFYQIEDLEWTWRFPASRLEVEAFAEVDLPRIGQESKYPYTEIQLNLSEEDLTWLGDLNRQLIAGAGNLSASRYSELITDHLWENFQYSLNPSRIDGTGDPVIGWLQEGNRGHCELFAASFVLLARKAGYPARMVVGFAGGAWNSVEAYFIVRNSDAHAWAEIYDVRTREWLQVDPTPGSGASDPEIPIRTSLKFESGWSAWFDSLRIQWYRRIVNFDEQDQIDMAMGLKDTFSEIKESLFGKFKVLFGRLKTMLQQPSKEISFVHIFFVFLAGVCFVFFWRFRFVWLRWLIALFRHPEALDPVRQQAGRYLRRLNLKQRQVDVKRLPTNVPEIRAQLEEVRFGPRVGEAEARAIFKQARRVLRGIR